MSLFKSASTVSLLTLVSRITGFARETLIAAVFGASALTDAFNVAFRIPNLFRRLFAEGAFSQAFVPVLAATRAEKGDDATRLLVDKVATLLAWAVLLTSIVGVLAAPVLVWLMASGLRQTPQGLQTAVNLTSLMFPYIACMSMVALAAGVLNTWRRFAVPAATPVLLNLSWIAAAWWVSPWLETQGVPPLYGVAAGVMVGGLLQLAIQAPALRRVGMVPRLGLSWQAVRQAWHHPGVGRVLRNMAPALLGVSVAQLSLLINTQIASHVAVGAVSWLTYADRLMEFPTALLGVALGVVLTPQLSAAQARGDLQAYSAMLDWGLRLVLLLAAPCAVALLACPEALVSVLYHYGRFSADDVSQTVRAVMGWGVGLVGLVAVKVLAPGYYARQDLRTPVRIAVVMLVLTQLLNLALVPWLGFAALALSIGLAALANTWLLLRGLLRLGVYRPEPGWWRFAMQVVAGCVVLAAALHAGQQLVAWTAPHTGPGWRVMALATLVIGGSALYLVSLHVLGVDWRTLMRRRHTHP